MLKIVFFYFPDRFTRFFGIKNTPEILNQAELGENSSCLLGYIRIMFFRCSKTRSFQIIRDKTHEKSWKYQPCFNVIALYSRVLSKCSNEHTNKLTFYYQFEFRFVFSFGNYAFAKNNHYPQFEITSCYFMNFTLSVILEKNGRRSTRSVK